MPGRSREMSRGVRPSDVQTHGGGGAFTKNGTTQGQGSAAPIQPLREMGMRRLEMNGRNPQCWAAHRSPVTRFDPLSGLYAPGANAPGLKKAITHGTA